MLSLKCHSNLLWGIGCQETGFVPHCVLTKVEGMGGGFTISSTGENRRPGVVALHNQGCVGEEEDRQDVMQRWWEGERLNGSGCIWWIC